MVRTPALWTPKTFSTSVQKGGLKVPRPFSVTPVPAFDIGKGGNLAHNQEAPIRAPWTLTFDLRERETIWTDENKGRLVKIIASNQLNINHDELDARLQELDTVIPDLGRKVHMMKPDLLAHLLQDLDRVTQKLISLKEIFPDANVSMMASKQPSLLLEDSQTISKEASKVCDLLDLESLDVLVDQHPGLLDSEAVQEVLDDLSRLMPKGTDVKRMLQMIRLSC